MIPTHSLRRWLWIAALGLAVFAAQISRSVLVADDTGPTGTQDANPQPSIPVPDEVQRGPGAEGKPGAKPPANLSSFLNVNRWAIVVGISKYQHQDWNLKYADRDAFELYALLQTPTGGGFEKDHIVFLTDEQATTRNITRALRGFLKKPAREDVVLLYFACHGTPDPDRPGVLYLLTHDTDPDDIAGTALPMREIQDSLRDYLAAERTVILADTCHSAAIAGAGRRNVGVAQATAVNNYLEQVSRSKEGTALLTSAEANEVSFEDAKWGGGHGVFTHYLLDGMRGNADNQVVDGIVTTGELFEYVRSQVMIATNSKQHPAIGTAGYDRLFPMGITGGVSAQRHFDLGRRLDELGWALRNKRLFRSAAQHLGEAQRLFGAGGATAQQAQANRLRGLALMAAGDHRGAIEALERAIALDRVGTPPETDFLLGVALARQGRWIDAQARLKSFLATARDDKRAPLARQLVTEAGPPGTRHALLIGIDEYARVPHLAGSKNDVSLIQRILTDRCGFSAQDIVPMLDRETTHDKILARLEHYSKNLKPADILWIFYSGHHVNRDGEYHLFVQDSTLEDVPGTTIGATELSGILDGLPASTTLFLDTGGPDRTTRFLQRMSRGAQFNVLIGASPGQLGHEGIVQGEQAERHGVFTHALAAELGRSRPSTTHLELLRRVAARMESESRAYVWAEQGQAPFFLGDPLQHILSRRSVLSDFDFTLMDEYTAMTRQELEAFASPSAHSAAIDCPEFFLQIGRAMLDRGANNGAVQVLGRAALSLRDTRPEVLLHLAVAQLRTGHGTTSSKALADYALIAKPSPPKAAIEESIAMIERSRQGPKHALLVGIDYYANPGIEGPKGAVNDVQAWKRTLVRNLGFHDPEVVVLLDRAATRAEILEGFQTLVRKAAGGPALFVFAGNGSRTQDGAPTLVPADGRAGDINDIEIAELTQMVGDTPTNLFTIFDVGWDSSVHPDDRFITPDRRSRPLPRDVGGNMSRSASQAFLTVGRHAVYTHLVVERSVLERGSTLIEAELPPLGGEAGRRPHGRLTQALLQSLDEADPATLTVSDWVERAATRLGSGRPLLKSNSPDELIFGDYRAVATIEGHLRRILLAPAREAIVLLRLLLEQRPDITVDANIDLGIASAAAEQYPESIAAFAAAIEQVRNREDPALGDAHYYLGHVLLEANIDLTRAVSELRQAVALRPEDARARYDLGQAIRKLIEQDLLAEAEASLRSYREAGAPLGRGEEVQAFLRSRERIPPLDRRVGDGPGDGAYGPISEVTRHRRG